MEQDFVTFKGKKIYVEDDILDLTGLGINSIKEIKGLQNITILEELYLGNNLIDKIEGLDNLTNLETLDLSHNHIKEIQGLDNLTNLWELNLSWNKIKEIKGLEILSKLQILDLSDNQITEIKGLENLTNLRYVYLWNEDWHGDTQIREDEREIVYWAAQEIVSYCQAKKEGKLHVTVKGKKYYAIRDRLDLSRLGITDIKEIEGLEKLTNLKELNLEGNEITEIKGLDTLINLEELDLNNNKIREVEGLENLKNLHSLYIQNNWMADSVQDLQLSDPVSLVKHCQDKKEGKASFVTVGGQKYYVIVDILDLIDRGITDITEIQGLETLINLRVLDLSDNKIKAIKGLETLSKLQILVLRRNQIVEIKGLENLINLQKLELDGNPIGETEKHLIEKNAQEIVRYCQEKARKAEN